jgi:hypothetical protein
MKVTRLNNNQIQIGNIVFSYSERSLQWIAEQPIAVNELDKYTNALHLFLRNESPEAEAYYQGYFDFINELKEILDSLNVCSEL